MSEIQKVIVWHKNGFVTAITLPGESINIGLAGECAGEVDLATAPGVTDPWPPKETEEAPKETQAKGKKAKTDAGTEAAA